MFAMKPFFKLEVLSLCLALGVSAGCASQSPAMAADAPAPAPAAHIVPLPYSMQTSPGELRIDGAVALEGGTAAPRAGRAVAELLATLHIATADA
ncbi:MAG TPA: hypothetical protein DD456_12770, partial [Stenotrophomonas sp.]|nr:hypothetical protein [Stenotrophomonas sp.]